LTSIENIFSSKGRVKVLKALIKLEETNINRLCRETGLHHRIVRSHLDFLEREGIISRITYGKVKIYKLNYSNPKTKILIDIFKELDI